MNISFVIPAFNEETYIESCLRSICLHCDNSAIEAEIIVIDNGSSDRAAQLARGYTRNVNSLSRPTVAHARNFGVQQANHEILAFIDGDVEITAHWVETFKQQYQRLLSDLQFLSGHQCIVPETGGWIEQYWFKNLKDRLLGGANMITSKTAFSQIDGFNEMLETGEDYDFCIRAIDAGLNYSTDAGFKALRLGFPHALHQFLRREYWHGKGDFVSLGHFLKSPVAMLAIAYLTAQILIIAGLIVGESMWSLLVLAGLLAGNLAITCKRFGSRGFRTVFINSFLNYAYFCARSFSAVGSRRK